MFTRFDFGREFVNVHPEGASTGVTPALEPFVDTDRPDVRLRKARSNADGLRRSIEQLRSFLVVPGGPVVRAGPAQGFIYLPPGRYLIGRPSTTPPSDPLADVRSDIVVPPDVTLWFAPGAVLVPLGDEPPRLEMLPVGEREKVYIEIQGDIIAGIQQIFDVVVNAEDTAHTAGEIILTSLRVRELYPDWWGATSTLDSPPIDVARRTTLAMQATLDAAFNHRNVRRREANGLPRDGLAFDRLLPSIPVVLKGLYDLAAELFIGVPKEALSGGAVPAGEPISQGGFELRGENGMVPATLRALFALVPQPAPMTPISRRGSGTMLTIRGPVSFSIRHVNFDGNHTAASCVAIEPVVEEWGWSSFEGCLFNACRHTLVRLDAEGRRRTPPSRMKPDFWNITFARCRFDVIEHQVAENTVNSKTYRQPESRGEVVLDGMTFEEGTLVAVEVRLKENEGLEFRNCYFVDVASPAIKAVSGRFALNETIFHVFRPPFPFVPSTVLDDTAGRNDSRHGADVSIESTSIDSKTAMREPGPWRRVIPATFTALECETHSTQFIATPDVLDAFDASGQTRSAVVLMNVRSSHEEKSERGLSEVGALNWYSMHGAEPPAIYWSYPGTMGCALIMVGCHTTGPRDKGGFSAVTEGDRAWSTRNRHVVYTGPNITGYVYDLASDMNPFYTMTNNAQARWNDLIFNGNTLYVSDWVSGRALGLRPNPRLIRRFRPQRFDQFLSPR